MQSLTLIENPFDFESHAVRVVMFDAEPWFVATDVATILDYRNAPKTRGQALQALGDA